MARVARSTAPVVTITNRIDAALWDRFCQERLKLGYATIGGAIEAALQTFLDGKPTPILPELPPPGEGHPLTRQVEVATELSGQEQEHPGDLLPSNDAISLDDLVPASDLLLRLEAVADIEPGDFTDHELDLPVNLGQPSGWVPPERDKEFLDAEREMMENFDRERRDREARLRR